MNLIQTKFEKIGIVGLGVVGTALQSWFKDKKFELIVYDKYKQTEPLKHMDEADIIFICVPTPYDGKNLLSNMSIIYDVLFNLPKNKIIVIKSTILPGTLDFFIGVYPENTFFHNPEFLSHETAYYDMLHPDMQIIGCREEHKHIASDILAILPKGTINKIVKPEESELLKYFCNTFFTVKIAFINQIYDICHKLNIDYDVIKDIIKYNKMISPFHLKVWHRGKRGYTGACLPKDIKAFIQFAKTFQIDMKLLETVEKINQKLLRGEK